MANRNPEQRPSPDALLEAARRESDNAGRLKIFVGAAPGVGKTYQMLSAGHRLREPARVGIASPPGSRSVRP
jgi:two-component system sensor histidine kinase KdpD